MLVKMETGASGGGGYDEYDVTFSPSVTTTSKTVSFNIKRVIIVTRKPNGTYINEYVVDDDKFYQVFSTDGTNYGWFAPLGNGASGITFTVNGGNFIFSTGGITEFNVLNRIILLG